MFGCGLSSFVLRPPSPPSAVCNSFNPLSAIHARAFSSRLSTTLTIVVTAVVVPGWLAQQLRQGRRTLVLPPGNQR